MLEPKEKTEKNGRESQTKLLEIDLCILELRKKIEF